MFWLSRWTNSGDPGCGPVPCAGAAAIRPATATHAAPSVRRLQTLDDIPSTPPGQSASVPIPLFPPERHVETLRRSVAWLHSAASFAEVEETLMRRTLIAAVAAAV